jgi:hypothetical protein
MESKILLIMIIIFVLLIFCNKNKEFFYQNSKCDTCRNLQINSPDGSIKKCNNFTIIDSNSTNSSDIYGPKCLNTCLVEHIPKINFEQALIQPTTPVDILKFNRENPNDGFCHSLNSKNDGINMCIGNCVQQCNQEENCEIKNNSCQEKSVNFLSGGSMLNSTKCSFKKGRDLGCVNKYIDSIETLKKIYDNEVEKIHSMKCVS